MFLSIIHFLPLSFLCISLCRGCCCAAGEALKDKCHENNVITAGGLFYPLIVHVKTFGIWSPFATEALKMIAVRTTAKSGLLTKKAFKN